MLGILPHSSSNRQAVATTSPPATWFGVTAANTSTSTRPTTVWKSTTSLRYWSTTARRCMDSCEELIRSYTSKEDCLYDLTARPAPLDLYEIRFSSHCQVSHSSPFPTRQAGNQDGGFEQGEEEDGLCTSPFEKCMLCEPVYQVVGQPRHSRTVLPLKDVLTLLIDILQCFLCIFLSFDSNIGVFLS